ncbi:hypothetical protein [Rubrivirga marina]|uniref:Uncharacterized protein n=1 Tax=Rubrivirga marina TaxID=1196024 RepID=A0A271IZ64_9BACT|nr:hypothetical protein [Rubrivirga marina]PAP76367.1 hypothetical protein BSZ37_07875 [Rubrivirga marina]
MSSYNLPGYGDACLCGSYGPCRCPPEPDADAYHQASYEAGYGHCTADGYDERPLTEWVYRTGYRVRYDRGPDGRPRATHVMTALRFAAFTWRHGHRSEAAYSVWFERQYRFDLASYLMGYDDAGAGLPSAVDDPERHRLCAEALDAYEPMPDLYDERLGPWPAPAEVDDGLPF